MSQIKKPKAEIATIDVCLVTIETADGEFGFDTANQIGVEPQIETQEAVKLTTKGILRAQKPAVETLTGNKITMTDTVFNPELVLTTQGGKIIYDAVATDKIIGYEPPAAGSGERGQVFKLNAYSAQYDASGQITQYEKISYPNCQGTPISFSSQDGTFRAPEYVVNSAPKADEPPYRIAYVAALPNIVTEFTLGMLNVTSVAGTVSGSTKITVSPSKEEYTNKYIYKLDASEVVAPQYGSVPVGYIAWDGKAEIVATTGNNLRIVECNSFGKAIASGAAVVAVMA